MSDTTNSATPRTRKPADAPAPALTPAAPDAKPPKPRRAPRPEIQAMNRIDGILAELGKDEIQRVLMWAIATHAPEGFSASTKLAPQAMCVRPGPIPADPDFPNAGP